MTYTMPNGKHAGEPITRVPVSYLRWMVNVGHSSAEYAQAELERRGTVNPRVEITGHAIDRASQRLLSFWLAECPTKEPGLHAWMVMRAEAALATLDARPTEGALRVKHGGVVWVFQFGQSYPVVATVMERGAHTDKRGRRRHSDRPVRTCPTCRDTAGVCECPEMP